MFSTVYRFFTGTEWDEDTEKRHVENSMKLTKVAVKKEVLLRNSEVCGLKINGLGGALLEYLPMLFIEVADKMKLENEAEHEKKKLELSKLWEITTEAAIAKIESSAMTELESVRDNTLEVEKEIMQLRERLVEVGADYARAEIEISRKTFKELEAQKDRNERLSEVHSQKVLENLSVIHEEEKRISDDVRAEKNANAKMLIEEMKEGTQQQAELATCNLNIQNASSERKNRKHVNLKIMEIKRQSTDLGRWYQETLEVIGAPPELYKKLTRKRRMKAKDSLIRFSEITSSIFSKFNELEQNLGRLELQDVDLKCVIQNIKSLISSFGEIIANIKLTIEIGEIIDSKRRDEFVILKNHLFEDINNIQLIYDGKRDIEKNLVDRFIKC
ncbi:Protein CBG18534 [Caenorhabditis briggsae]|uniref:Protein CBG18534 n=1 Tax=Caenorhabditis briggsae TaxID=6238 RepID=A8XTI7_CAEBR|nr:Protein CBG18534 [Caenorhabditis briggsae]CAP35964.1 Protein CBG18534 [Caenorhabditis briggsae]